MALAVSLLALSVGTAAAALTSQPISPVLASCDGSSAARLAVLRGGRTQQCVPTTSAAHTRAALLRLRGGVREVADMDDWEALQEEAADRLLVVDFTATWCGPCQMIAPTYAALAEEYAESAILVKVDVDELGELAQQLGVTSMPTFLFFRNGEMIDSMRGADEAGLRALVAEHASAPVAA